MHRAPAVNFTVKRSRLQARLIGYVGLLTVTIFAIFVRDQPAVNIQIGVLTLSIVLAGSTAYLGWKRAPQGNLRWDGEHWYWSDFDRKMLCRLNLLADFQSVVVVTLTAEGRPPVFLWLEAPLDGANWKPLRRAIVSSQAASGGETKKTSPGLEGDLA